MIRDEKERAREPCRRTSPVSSTPWDTCSRLSTMRCARARRRRSLHATTWTPSFPCSTAMRTRTVLSLRMLIPLCVWMKRIPSTPFSLTFPNHMQVGLVDGVDGQPFSTRTAFCVATVASAALVRASSKFKRIARRCAMQATSVGKGMEVNGSDRDDRGAAAGVRVEQH